jgi:hypothetical protein
MCHGGTGQRPDRSHHRGEHLGRSQTERVNDFDTAGFGI